MIVFMAWDTGRHPTLSLIDTIWEVMSGVFWERTCHGLKVQPEGTVSIAPCTLLLFGCTQLCIVLSQRLQVMNLLS